VTRHNLRVQSTLIALLTATRPTSSIARVGRSLGFKRVVTGIGDPQFEGTCHVLGLKGTIVPSRTISRDLEDMVGGTENVNLSTITMRGDNILVWKRKPY